MLALVALGCNSEKSSADADLKPLTNTTSAQKVETNVENTVVIAFGNDNEGELAPCG